MPAACRLLLLTTIVALGMAADAAASGCRGTLFLTFDTGNMAHAEAIATTLRDHDVLATFFLANEKTTRGDHAMDDSWKTYWAGRVSEGHAFGTHTWRHGKVVRDAGEAAIVYRPEFPAGPPETLSPAAYCNELKQVDAAFRRHTGRALDPLWRAPGGRTSAHAIAAAKACGYAHVHWSPAGFLGDELPSERYSNRTLVDRAVRDLKDGDILLMHLGIWSRRDAFAPMLGELITRLKARDLCFATLPARG